MQFPPWSVLRTPPLEWRMPENESEWIDFHHMQTVVTQVRDNGCAYGTALWAGDLAGSRAYMAFDWAEMRPGVAILTDPNTVVSNLVFVSCGDEVDRRLREVTNLMGMLHRLDWQPFAVEHADRHRAAARECVTAFSGGSLQAGQPTQSGPAVLHAA